MSSASTNGRRQNIQAAYEAAEAARRQSEITETEVSNRNTEQINRSTSNSNERLQTIQAAYEAAEARRQQRIAEYTAFNNSISQANREFANYYQELQEIENVVKTNFTGEKANELIQSITTCRNRCEDVVGELNNQGKKVAEKINAEGQIYAFTGTNISSSNGKSNSYNQTFSCNTELLKNSVLNKLEEVYGKIVVTTSTLSNVKVPEGCGSLDGTINSMQNTNAQITNIYSQTLEFINDVEAMEKENMELIGALNARYDASKAFTVSVGKGQGSTDNKNTKINIPKQSQSNAASTFGQNITYTEQNIMGARVLVPSTANDGTTKKVTVMLTGYQSKMGENVWIVQHGMESNSLRYNGYTAIMDWRATTTDVESVINELSKQYNVDLNNIELVGFSWGANQSFETVSKINNSNNGIHISSLDYLGGNEDNEECREEVLNDDSVKVTVYYGEGDGAGIHRNINNNLKGVDGVDVYKLKAGHATDVGGIVDVFFSTYAHDKQNLKK